MNRLRIWGVMFFLLTGCARVDGTLLAGTTTGALLKYVKSYRLGEQQEAYVGNPVVRVSETSYRTEQQKHFAPEKDFEISGNFSQRWFTANHQVHKKFKAGEPLKVVRQVNHAETYYDAISFTDDNGETYALLVDPYSNALFEEHLVTDDWQYFLSGPLPTVRFKKIQVEVGTPLITGTGLVTELLYTGISNASINLTHREYMASPSKDNQLLARPAFFQPVTYKESQEVIRFQNTKIKVHQATNEKLVYTVVEDEIPDGFITP